MQESPQTLPTIKNLKQLNLDIFTYQQSTKDVDLVCVLNLLKATPLLEELIITVSNYKPARAVYWVYTCLDWSPYGNYNDITRQNNLKFLNNVFAFSVKSYAKMALLVFNFHLNNFLFIYVLWY